MKRTTPLLLWAILVLLAGPVPRASADIIYPDIGEDGTLSSRVPFTWAESTGLADDSWLPGGTIVRGDDLEESRGAMKIWIMGHPGWGPVWANGHQGNDRGDDGNLVPVVLPNGKSIDVPAVAASHMSFVLEPRVAAQPSAAPVPEPATLLLVASGAALGARRLRRKI